MNYRVKFILSIITFVCTPFAFGSQVPQEENDASSGTSKKNISDFSDLESHYSPFRIFGGLGTGFGSVFGNEFLHSPSGAQFLLGAHLSYQFHSWEIESGLSWLYSNLGGSNSSNLPIQIQTRLGFFDLGARYRIGQRWQVGPVVNVAFGTDTSFSPTVGSSNTAVFAGLKGVYEFYIQQFPMQIWSQVSTDVSISNRQVVLGLVGLQIGIPIGLKKSSEAQVETMPPPLAISARVSNEELRVALDPQKVFFGTNSDHLRSNVKEILQNLGSHLRKDPDEVRSIEIAGHADQRGRFAYNMKLSKRRSNSVRKALLEGGVDGTKLKVRGYSYLKPLDTANNSLAWAKNRRVEIVFRDVKNPDSIIEILRPLMSPTSLIFN